MEIGHADPVTPMLELGIGLDVGSRGARVGPLIAGGVTAVTASAVFCASEERVQAPEPRLALGLIPLPETVEKADQPIGRTGSKAFGGRHPLERVAEAFELEPGQARHREGRSVRAREAGALIRSPRSPARAVRSCSCSPTRWRQPQLICSRSTAAWSNTKRAPAECPMAVTIAARADRSSVGSARWAAGDDAGAVVGERWPLPDAGALLEAMSSSTEATRAEGLPLCSAQNRAPGTT
jgi:hypothetical protein